MSGPDELDDDTLMALLRDAVGAEASEVEDRAATSRRAAAARGAFAWRSVDEELAALLHDSALEASGARSGGGGPRVLSFGRGGVSVEVDLDGGDLRGQVVGHGEATGPVRVALQRPDGAERAVEADEDGLFVVPDVPAGSARLRVEVGGWSLTTPWVVL